MDEEQQIRVCKALPLQACTGHKCSRRLNLSGILDNLHRKVAKLLDLLSGRHYPLVLIYVGGRQQLGSRLCYSDSGTKKRKNTLVHNGFAKDLSLADTKSKHLFLTYRNRLNNTVQITFMCVIRNRRGPGSSVGIATDYGLDGPGSNPGGEEVFRPSRPALGPTHSPAKWVPGVYWG